MDINSMSQEALKSKEVFAYLMSINDGFERTQTELKIKQKYDKPSEFVELYKQFKISAAKKNIPEIGQKTKFIGQPLEIYCGDWLADNSGIIKNEFNFTTGGIQTKEASRIPVLPVEIYENMDTGIEKVKLAFYKDNAWKSIVCEKVTISNQGKIVELSNMGIEVTTESSKYLVKYLHDCITLNPPEIIQRYKSVGRMGWVSEQFMPYDVDIKFDGEKENRYLFQAIHSSGSYEKWVEFIKPLRKNIQFRLLLSASFASVLLEKVSALPFVFHLWGGTGTGKTVALMCAASIWGNPAMGKMTRTMNMTSNSMLSTAAFLHNLPFIGDELQIIKSKWENYDTLIMRITEGIDRGRMSYDKVQETKSWNCAFLFTGEEPCTKAESGGGVINRVIDIECTDVVVIDGNKTVNFINKNFGHAGMKFIDIIRNKDLNQRYEAIFNDILKSSDTTEKQALSMSVILLADEISSKYIFRDDPLKVSDITCFLMSKKDVDVSERAYEYVMSLISSNINNFSSSFSGECWGKISDLTIWFDKRILVRELNNSGFSFEAVKKKWADKGYLQKSSQNRFMHQRNINGIYANFIKIIVSDRSVFTQNVIDTDNPFI